MEDFFGTLFGGRGRGRGGAGSGAGRGNAQPPPGAGAQAGRGAGFTFNLGGGGANPFMNMAQNAAAFQDIMNDLQSFTSGMMVDEDGWQVPTQEFLSQTHEPPKGPPPASRRVVTRMPDVEVTAEDLLVDANDSCCICMEDHVLGNKVMKLPCGHIFHRPCVTEWLERHCTCPVCRFECETEDRQYEAERRKRIRMRRLRFKEGELEKKPTLEVKRIMESVGLSTAGCLEKGDMIAKLLSSGFVDLVDASVASPGMEGAKGLPSMKLCELNAMPLGDLKKLMRELGVSSVGCCEKKEMVDLVVSSGRVHIVSTEDTMEVEITDSGAGSGGGEGFVASASSSHVHVEVEMEQEAPAFSPSSAPSPSAAGPSTAPPPPVTPSTPAPPASQGVPTCEDLNRMSVAEVKRLMRQLGVSSEGCLEKADLVRALVESGQVAPPATAMA